MREKPWAVVNLLNPDAEIMWYTSEMDAALAHRGEAVDIQYRPGRKGKVKKNGQK